MFDPYEDTVEFLASEIDLESFFSSSYSPSDIIVGSVTHPGKKRTENQDHYAVIRRNRSQQVMASDVPLDAIRAIKETAYLLMVADGIGGSAFGEVASRLVIQKVWELTIQSASWVMRLRDMDSQQVHQRVRAYIRALQRFLQQQSKENPSLMNMGTTLTAVYVIGHDAILSHVGDSRVYLLRNGHLEQMTHDQTLAMKMLHMGYDSEQVADLNHILTNYLGTGSNPGAEVEIRRIELHDGDRILLCSDGLTKELSDDEIRSYLIRTETPQKICDALLAQALDRGGRDNVTIVLAQVESSG